MKGLKEWRKLRSNSGKSIICFAISSRDGDTTYKNFVHTNPFLANAPISYPHENTRKPDFLVFSESMQCDDSRNWLDYVYIVKNWLKRNMLESTFKTAGTSYSQKLNITITPKVQSNIWTSAISLTLSWQVKSWDWFLHDGHERVNRVLENKLTLTNVNKNLLKCLGTLNWIIWKKKEIRSKTIKDSDILNLSLPVHFRRLY